MSLASFHLKLRDEMEELIKIREKVSLMNCSIKKNSGYTKVCSQSYSMKPLMCYNFHNNVHLWATCAIISCDLAIFTTSCIVTSSEREKLEQRNIKRSRIIELTGMATGLGTTINVIKREFMAFSSTAKKI